MKNCFVKLFICAAILFVSAGVSFAQKSRKSVPASEVNGTFQMHYRGKYKGNYNEIKILALGGGKLKVEFGLVYPYFNGKEPMVNVGNAQGEAKISGDTAVYTNSDFSECKITIKFVKPGTINVTQDGLCGFGLNVTADGSYRRTSSRKPKFNSELF